MKWCNSQASASCFNSQVQTSCASFSMALLLLKMLALGWGARKNVQRKGLNANQLIWLKSLMPESMRCLNDQAQWSDAKWSLHASVSHWSCSARLKHFLLKFDKKMLSNLKTLSKIKSKSHTHTHTCKCPDFDQNSRVLRVNVKSTMARKNRWQQNLCFVKA